MAKKTATPKNGAIRSQRSNVANKLNNHRAWDSLSNQMQKLQSISIDEGQFNQSNNRLTSSKKRSQNQLETNHSEMVLGVLEPDETLPEERDTYQVSMIEIDSQVPDGIGQQLATDDDDLDESNANFDDNEGRADPVIASSPSPAFSNHDFRQKYTQMLMSGNGSLVESCSNQDF